MRAKAWSLSIDTVAVVFIALFCGAGVWGLLQDDTMSSVHTALGALRTDPNVVLLGSRDLSEYWRPWGADVARVEEIVGYAYLASMLISLFLTKLRFQLLPPLASAIAQLRRAVLRELAVGGRPSLLPFPVGGGNFLREQGAMLMGLMRLTH